MDTKSLMIETATHLFQQKGYKNVGVNEILKACNVTKGALYHHFPNGKEELLIACLKGLNEAITIDIEDIFKKHPSTLEAIQSMIDKLIHNLETEGTITGYTFSSIVSEMATVSEPVRQACSLLYENMERIYCDKLVTEGYSQESASEMALWMTASIEGAMMLCLTQKSTTPLKTIAKLLPTILKGRTS
ncbi:TetR/AcrR family transcriptional regulator [Paenibacillus sp. FSL R7-0048]|uniref:TetR/AcrR family transcriptional regulator n=1 Tax=Paenibacillus TaxID=44249 RepID=UPI00096EA260|nr:TetR/AcrR family transcriptional regulator [Paenibacillus odorifer]OMC65905.1 TetR family transcriptional regulator [Paenibacillus odorifer]OMD74371.1 TetR family transcriptional regulator [Paenibacillus odorifer]OME05572.1 TetR family transcriptional regulator [Paenibacillus odorifer]OME09267.1 TetR family transcriptional regulator [Paenibacillus odorifer]